MLEEDHNSSHGIPKDKKGIVQDWKRSHGLQHYFNCSGSPDLTLIENAWQPLKQALKRVPHWTKEEIEEIATEAWYDQLKQRSINKWVLSMPQRLQAVIDNEGHLTGY